MGKSNASQYANFGSLPKFLNLLSLLLYLTYHIIIPSAKLLIFHYTYIQYDIFINHIAVLSARPIRLKADFPEVL